MSQKWVLAFLLSCYFILSPVYSVEGLTGGSKVRGVNLGGWLVVEGWIHPALFADIPNGDMLDGRQVQLKSVTLQKYVAAENGGGSIVSVNRSSASAWETFRLWRVSESKFNFRTAAGQFLTCQGAGCTVSATANAPPNAAFHVERSDDGKRAHIKLANGRSYLQAVENKLTLDYPGTPGWDDNAATFEITFIDGKFDGDYQLINGYGFNRAKEVLKRHRETFITEQDFVFLSRNGINTVRIPVGWWIAYDPNPPSPFVGGTLEALDKAFSWAKAHNIKCITDLHAAPGSQNGFSHSATRDGTADWAKSSENISKSLSVINFLASRYAKHPALLGIELLNEPQVNVVPLDTLVSYYKRGYDIVRKHSQTAYVILSQRVGNADPTELFKASIGSQNVVVDFHYYSLFGRLFNGMSTADNIKYIYNNRRPQIQSHNAANGPLVFIGEWVNEYASNQRSLKDYQDFGKAQLEVYGEASFGWAYWTIKNVNERWDLEKSITNNYLLIGNSSVRA